MKGLSPLVSTILLIALTVSTAGIVTTWLTTLAKEQTASIGNKTTTAIDCTSANIDIKDVYIDMSANMSRVIVWNSGQINIDIMSASVLSKMGENATLNTTLPMRLSAGAMTTIKFNISSSINSMENFSQAIVSTNCVGISDRFTGAPKGS